MTDSLIWQRSVARIVPSTDIPTGWWHTPLPADPVDAALVVIALAADDPLFPEREAWTALRGTVVWRARFGVELPAVEPQLKRTLVGDRRPVAPAGYGRPGGRR